jgi:hypothetical protein
MTALALAAAALAAPSALAQNGGGGGGGGDTRFQAVGVGALEVPPNTSPGSAVTIIDIAGTNVAVNSQFRDLVADASAAHIHCCTGSAFTGTAPIAVPFTDFPTGVAAGTYNKTLDMSVDTAFDAGFLGSNGGTASSAFSALQAGIAANEAYVNIHTAQYPQGEIRGWLVAAPIPEPATWAMLGIGLAGLGFMARRRVG